MNRPHRIGLVGAGGMGTFHGRTLADLPDADVVTVADPFGDAAASLAAELGAASTLDPVEVVRDETLDAVVIASPDETHADLTLTAMASGLRVLCEKPLATSVADGQAVIDAEVALGTRVVQLGFMREYDLPHRQVIEAIAGRGAVLLIKSLHRNANEVPRTDLGVIGQSAVHDIHSARFMTGAEISAVTTYATRRPDGHLRHVVLMLELDNGGHGLVEFDDNGYAYEVMVDVTTEVGTVSTAGPVRAVERFDAQVATNVGRDWFGWFADAYRAQDAAWVASLNDSAASGPSVWDGLVAQIVVDAALASLDDGGRVEVTTPAMPDLYR